MHKLFHNYLTKVSQQHNALFSRGGGGLCGEGGERGHQRQGEPGHLHRPPARGHVRKLFTYIEKVGLSPVVHCALPGHSGHWTVGWSDYALL